jgi:hypothetical protein
VVGLAARAIGHAARQDDLPEPPGATLGQVFANQDRASVSVDVVGRRGPVPLHVQVDDRRLDQVIGALPVLAEPEREAAQPRQPGLHILGELAVAVMAGQRALPGRNVVPCPLVASSGLSGCMRGKSYR